MATQNTLSLSQTEGIIKISSLESVLTILGSRGTKTSTQPRVSQINKDSSIFNTSRTSRFLLDQQHLFSYKERVVLSNLDMPFSLEEIKHIVFDLGADKAPSLDGFPIFFFQKHLDIVKYSLSCLCNDFFKGRVNLEPSIGSTQL